MSLLRPDRYFTDVHAIDLDALRRAGIDGLLVDIDNTILPRDTNVITPEAARWAANLKRRGFRVCLISNNWHERVYLLAGELGFDIVAKAVKPLPFAFRAALRRVGLRARQCAVIGDQLFTDILGGNLLGATTILVRPLSTSDLPHTLALRLLERRIMAEREPEA